MGLDISRRALDAFQQRSQDVPLVQGDVLCLPFARGSLDCVVAIHCFDHLDRIRFLQECSCVLRIGGLLIFDLVNRHSYKVILKRLRHWLSIAPTGNPSDKWIDVYSCREALSAIAHAGLDVQAVSGYGWIPFDVNSESKLVHVAARAEQVLRLATFPSVSPRVLVAARKQVDH